MKRRRAGVALVAALALMAVIGLLIAGAVASSTLAMRSSRLASVDAELSAAAEFAVNSLLAGRALADLPFGEAVAFDDAPTPAANVRTRVVATRLPAGVVWLVAEARRRDVDAGTRRVNVVARWRFPSAVPGAPLVSRGNVRVDPGVPFAVDVTGDPDCRARTDAPHVLIAPGAVVTAPESLRVVVGAAAADSASYFVATRGVADTGFVGVSGDTTLYGGSLDGVVLVDGAVSIAGPVTVNGLLVARGRIEVTAGALFLTGAAMSFAPPDSSHAAVRIGRGSIRYSPCVISRVLRRVIPLRPVRQRGWAEVF